MYRKVSSQLEFNVFTYAGAALSAITARKNTRHIKILVQPGEAVGGTLKKSYEPHFTLCLDDQRKFAQLIAYLIPGTGLEKKFLNSNDKYLQSWTYPPSKNYANSENQIPSDLAEIGISIKSFVLFAHPSKN